MMEFILIYDKQTFWGCFIWAFFNVFVCLLSFASLLNGILEFIKILFAFFFETSSAILSFAEFVHIFGTESCSVVSELNQIFKYFNKLFAKKLLPFCYVSVIYKVNIFLTTIIRWRFLASVTFLSNFFDIFM